VWPPEGSFCTIDPFRFLNDFSRASHISFDSRSRPY
jgi:hypothetical protein